MIEITTANFEQEVMNSDKPVFLDFWAEWCGFCIQLSPTVDALAEEYGDRYKFGKINIDENPQLAAQFGILSIPVTMVIENGQERSKVMGAYPKEELAAKHEL